MFHDRCSKQILFIRCPEFATINYLPHEQPNQEKKFICKAQKKIKPATKRQKTVKHKFTSQRYTYMDANQKNGIKKDALAEVAIEL
jgi:hypothetical protein